jgi:hypothetical protein
MKKAAIRYAEILEAGAWVTQQEQTEIAMLLRKLATKDWVGLENIDFQYQPPAEVITMKYAEAILKEKNNG